MPRKGKYRDAAPIVLQRLSEGDNIKTACRHAGINVDSFFTWLKVKVGFAEAVKNAQETFRTNIQSRLESSLWEKALGGKKIEEVVSEYAAGVDGKPVIVKQRRTSKELPSDTAAIIFALTNVAPDKWVNRQERRSEVEVKGVSVTVESQEQKDKLDAIENMNL